MNYELHPEAASEHEEQVAYYELRANGLGQRYHAAFLSAIHQVGDSPQRHKVITGSDIRSAPIHGFPYQIIFRERGSSIQVLAIAHHRRRPGYWASRL